MVIKRILCAALLLAGLMSSTEVSAQIRWTGNDLTTLDGSTQTNKTEVFLYNVGTGRFLVHGGDWGTQARLFYNDSGKKLIFYKSGSGNNATISFDTGMTTKKGNNDCKWLYSHMFPENISTNDQNSYTINMDGVASDGNWNFQRIPGETGNEVYTYYLSQGTGNNKRWMGAAYGENRQNFEGDPNGKLALLSSSYDKAVWSTADPNDNEAKYECELKPVEGTGTVERTMATEVQVFNADTKVPLRDLYKWRIVTKEQLLATLSATDVGDGLSTNLTYLINDRGFERNDYSFFNSDDGWNVNRISGTTYSGRGSGRYLYTWGFVSGTSTNAVRQTQQEANGGSRTIDNQCYMQPVRLKAQFDDGDHNPGKSAAEGGGVKDGFAGKPDAKFGFLEFEGVGTVSTYIEAPANGVYRVSAYGFYQNGGDNDHPAYFFATTKNPSELTMADINNPNVVSLSPALKEVEGYNKNLKGNENENAVGVYQAGYDFVYDKTDYRRELQISVNAGQKIYFGVVKLDATETQSTQARYYYDSDWVGADQFDIVYLGTQNAVWFDDRNTTYFDNSDIAQNNQYNNRAVRFHRTFAQGQWNSFVFPMNLTAVQVRHAFGDGTQVAVLHGLGTLSGNKEIIDFQSIALPAEGAAITAGQMYIIKPENGPLTSSVTDPYGEEPYRTYYDMGNATFNSSSLPATPDDSYWVSDIGAFKGRADGATVAVKAHATYFNGTAIPAGSYVLGQHKKTKKYNMYYLTSGTTIKGFRGWITDDDSVLGGLSKSISINGVLDETDAIDGLTMDERLLQNGAIYDLSGRKVGAVANMSQLPKGLYIVNGKKYVVK